MCVPSEDKENIGLLLSNIPFTHPIQLSNLIKLLRQQAIYNLLLTSCCTVKTNDGSYDTDSTDDDIEMKVDKARHRFRVNTASWNTLTVTFIHPIDGTIASVDFTLSMECYIECCLNTMPDSPQFTTGAYINNVVNRCLSIPITMRSILIQSLSWTPEDADLQKSRGEKKAVRPIKLQMPSLAQIQSEIPLMSPHLLSSPSTFLNFSPGAPLFVTDPVQKGTISKRRTPGGGTTPLLDTPNSDGSRTPNKQKLPVLKLKRRKVEDNEVYEIEQKSSTTEVIGLHSKPYFSSSNGFYNADTFLKFLYRYLYP